MASSYSSLTQERLKSLYQYHPETGLFTHLTNSRVRKIGDIVGMTRKDGYMQTKVDKHFYVLHRLAWLYVYGEWPKYEIDHINRQRNDNRIVNLRDIKRSENNRNKPLGKNNVSGHSGISWSTKSKKWCVKFNFDCYVHHVGFFANLDDAVEAKQKKMNELRYNVLKDKGMI